MFQHSAFDILHSGCAFQQPVRWTAYLEPGLVCEMQVLCFGPAPQFDGPAKYPALLRAAIFLDHQVDARDAFNAVPSIDRRHAVALCRTPPAKSSLMADRASVSVHERGRPLQAPTPLDSTAPTGRRLPLHGSRTTGRWRRSGTCRHQQIVFGSARNAKRCVTGSS